MEWHSGGALWQRTGSASAGTEEQRMRGGAEKVSSAAAQECAFAALQQDSRTLQDLPVDGAPYGSTLRAAERPLVQREALYGGTA